MPPIWNPQPNKVLREWIDTIIEEAGDELNEWETRFIANMCDLIYNGRFLTENQEKKLEQIYAEKTK